MMTKSCSVCGKTDGKIYGRNNLYGLPICERHYAQFRRVGRILDTSPRSSKDRNEIVSRGSYADIILYKNSSEAGRAVIDKESIDKVSPYKWRLMDSGYVVSKISGKTALLHRLVTDCPPDMYVDHINHNKLDNRSSNLRVCTAQENSFNKGIFSQNVSGHTGVSYDYFRKRWVARIMVSGKNLFLGRFDSKEDAISARRIAEGKYFGEFAYDKEVVGID